MSNETKQLPSLISEPELAKALGVSPALLKKWRAERSNIPFVRLGARVMYRTDDVNRHINEHMVHPYENTRTNPKANAP